MTRIFWAAVLVTIGCNPQANPPREIQIDTPDGEMTVLQTTEDAVSQKIEVVRGDELQRLQTLANQGPEFVAHYLPEVTTPGLKDYDAAFAAWQRDAAPPFNARQVVEIVGGYLGNKCVADLEMEWILLTDQYGSDYAVRGVKNEVTSFPFAAVQKRIDDNKHDFVYGIYYAIKQQLASGEYQQRAEGE